MSKINANDILLAIRRRHTKDLFVAECKDGPTWGGRHFRMDAWAMRKSYASPCMTGYEIKVSRSDFMHDAKWTAYLYLCNEFYFACPTGLIAVDETPEQAGLLWASPNGRRVYIKKKAPYREIEPPVPLLTYLLFSRVRVTAYPDAQDSATYWRQWLATKKENRELGWNVSKTIYNMVHERIEKVERKNKELVERIRDLDRFREELRAAGIDADNVGYWANDKRTQQITALQQLVSPDLKRAVDTVSSACASFNKTCERLEHEAANGVGS